MTYVTKFFVLAIALALQACAGPLASNRDTTKEALIARDKERRKAYEIQFQPLIGKLWMESLSKAPLRAFTDDRRVVDADKPALEAVYQYVRESLDDFEESVQKRYSHYTPLLPGLRAGRQGLLIALYKGEISYGEYHTRLREFYVKQTAAFREKDTEFLSGLIAQGSGAATSDFYGYLRAIQLVNSSNQPSTAIPLTINIYQEAPRPPVNVMPPPMPGIIRR